MSEYERLKIEYDRLKAKQDGKIAALVLRKAHDKLTEQYNNSRDDDPRAQGYRDGLLSALVLLIQMIQEFEGTKG